MGAPVGPSCRDLRTYSARARGEILGVVVPTKQAAHAFLTHRRIAVTGVSREPKGHGSFGRGSVSAPAATYGRAHGMIVIDGGCPLMYGPTADAGPKVICALFTMTGKVPRQV
jgi:uncharacterized protein